MVHVSIEDELASFPNIQKISEAVAIFEASKQQIYANFLGHYSGLDNNLLAKNTGLNKLHIALTKEEMETKKWHLNARFPQNRTSDNFLIFVRHWLYTNYIRILAIVTPEAHKRIDSFIPELVDKAERFYSLNKETLSQQSQQVPRDLVVGKEIR